MFNLSATVNVGRLLWAPLLCMPQLTVKQFCELPVPVASHIRGVVVDKDNCFAEDGDDKVWPAYQSTWDKLKSHYEDRLLIVSNSAGTNDDVDHAQAKALEANTGVSVLRHSTKKPGCHQEILDYYSKFGIGAHEIAVVGDRLFTDVMMANMMGAYGVWVSEGVELSQKVFPSVERALYERMKAK
ncbi:phosphatidylglycerophosphatase Gep4p, mitochondrial [Diutina catenulata]